MAARAHASPWRAGDRLRRNISHARSTCSRPLQLLRPARWVIRPTVGAVRRDTFDFFATVMAIASLWVEALVIAPPFLAICRQVVAVVIRYRLIRLRRGARAVALAIKANNPRLATRAVPDSCQTCEGKCGQ